MNTMVKQGEENLQLNLEISPGLWGLVTKLAHDTASSSDEVLRKAIVLMDVAVEAKTKGNKIWISDRDKQLKTEIVGLLPGDTP